jgi:hypothetical protein
MTRRTYIAKPRLRERRNGPKINPKCRACGHFDRARRACNIPDADRTRCPIMTPARLADALQKTLMRQAEKTETAQLLAAAIGDACIVVTRKARNEADKVAKRDAEHFITHPGAWFAVMCEGAGLDAQWTRDRIAGFMAAINNASGEGREV